MMTPNPALDWYGSLRPISMRSHDMEPETAVSMVEAVADAQDRADDRGRSEAFLDARRIERIAQEKSDLAKVFPSYEALRAQGLNPWEAAARLKAQRERADGC